MNRKTGKINLTIYIALCFLFHLSACSKSSKKRPEIQYPREITFPGTNEKGVFDPSMSLDPSTGRIWMSYSSIKISQQWVLHDAISIRLAYSDDNGYTWYDNNIEINISFDNNDSNFTQTWNNEVSCIIYDKVETDLNKKWKILWHRYPWIDTKRAYSVGWISMKTAPSPNGPWIPVERKLFVGSDYDNATDVLFGSPEYRLNQLHPDLNSCLAFSEPGMLSTDDALYVSLLCAEGNSTDGKIILLKWPNDTNGTFVYKGTFIDNKTDGPLLGYHGLSAGDIYKKSGKYYLITTPQNNEKYLGTYIFEIVDLETASIKQIGGTPVIYSSVMGVAGSHNGAAGYISDAAACGIMYSEVIVDEPPFYFRIFCSGKNP